MTRLHPGLRDTVQGLIDDVVFRFSMDSKEAQDQLQMVLADQSLINAVCVRIQLRRMDDNDESTGGKRGK